MAGPGAKAALGTRPLIRLDKWLWQARFFKTRSDAVDCIEGGKCRINGQRCRKPGHGVGADDVLTFAAGGRIRVIRILELGERRGPAAEAQQLYTDLEPLAPDPASRLE